MHSKACLKKLTKRAWRNKDGAKARLPRRATCVYSQHRCTHRLSSKNPRPISAKRSAGLGEVVHPNNLLPRRSLVSTPNRFLDLCRHCSGVQSRAIMMNNNHSARRLPRLVRRDVVKTRQTASCALNSSSLPSWKAYSVRSLDRPRHKALVPPFLPRIGQAIKEACFERRKYSRTGTPEK